MKVLLDTQAWLWWVLDDARLGRQAREIVATGRPVLSVVSFWEIAIKVSLGKLDVELRELIAVADRQGVERLGLTDAHILGAGRPAPAPPRPVRPHADRAGPSGEHEPSDRRPHPWPPTTAPCCPLEAERPGASGLGAARRAEALAILRRLSQPSREGCPRAGVPEPHRKERTECVPCPGSRSAPAWSAPPPQRLSRASPRSWW